MKIAVEIFLLAILVACAWNGYKKGLIMGIGTILAIILSLYMGDLLSDTFSQEASPVVHPFVSGYMDGNEGVIGKSMSELMGVSQLDLSLEDALKKNPELKYELGEMSYKKMGINSSEAKKMTLVAAEIADRTGASFSGTLVNVMCDYLVYYIGFFLFFVIILIILIVIGNITNLSFRIPGMNALNNYGGLAAGIITGILFCSVIAAVLRLTGVIYPEEEYSKSLLAALFVKMNLLSGFISA